MIFVDVYVSTYIAVLNSRLWFRKLRLLYHLRNYIHRSLNLLQVGFDGYELVIKTSPKALPLLVWFTPLRNVTVSIHSKGFKDRTTEQGISISNLHKCHFKKSPFFQPVNMVVWNSFGCLYWCVIICMLRWEGMALNNLLD